MDRFLIVPFLVVYPKTKTNKEKDKNIEFMSNKYLMESIKVVGLI